MEKTRNGVMNYDNVNKMVVVVKGVIVNEGNVLIVQRASDDEVGSGTWECVGGKVDFGEDLEQALVREIQEEVGLTVSVEMILYATTFKTDPSRQVVLLTYLCGSEGRAVILSEEHSNFSWVTKEQARITLTPEIVSEIESYSVFELNQWD